MKMSEFSAQSGQGNFGNSSAYAAALQRARQIAAKINPNAAETTGKRELEDAYQPESKKLAGIDLADANSPLSRPLLSNMGYGPEGMILTEEITVPDRIVGLIIGRGGEQITRLQSESGCKIQMERSRGTADRACTLTGSREAINRAKEMVMTLVATLSRNDNFANAGPGAGGGGGLGGGVGGGDDFHSGGSGGPGSGTYVEIMVPAPKVGLIIGKGGETIKNLQDSSGCKMVVVQDSSTPEHEKPLRITGNPQQVEHAKDLVYQLLVDKETGRRPDRNNGGFGGQNNFNNDYNNGGYGGGGGGGGGNGGGGPGSGVVEILVPRAAVGVVIGKGGEMIKKIQGETGAKLQFEQGRDDGPGDRKCILTGKPQQCEEARQRVEELIDSVQRRDGEVAAGGGGGGGRDRGRGGSGRERRDNGGGGGYDRGNRQGGDRWGGNNGGGRTEITFTVPASRAGFVIGRGGETIKQINAQSGAHCEIDRKNPSNQAANERVFTIRGTPDQIEEAKRLIIEKSGIEEQPYSGGMYNQMAPPTSTAYPNQSGFQAAAGGGGGGGGGGNNWATPASNNYQWGGGSGDSGSGNPPANPNGQQDFTLQWAEYYRNMGMTREAEAIEANAKNKQMATVPGGGVGMNPAPAAGNPAQPNGAQDYSAQWADYYRSLGKIKEAEAIEAQMKAKQQAAVTAGPAPGVQQPLMAQPQQGGGQYGQYGGYQQPQGNPAPYYGGAPAGQHPNQYGYQGGYAGNYGQPGPN